MKKINVFLMSAIALVVIIGFSAFANSKNVQVEPACRDGVKEESNEQQMVHLFVTHGHCSSPFSGKVENMKVTTMNRTDGGNPLENMQMSFEINPETFASCRYEEIASRVQTPGVFISEEKKENIKFKSTRVHTMGMDWYEVNGTLSIKGVESDVKLFVSGIREPKESMASMLVLEGQIDLTDWGIDYDLQVYGEPNEYPTKWMHINMKIDLPQNC